MKAEQIRELSADEVSTRIAELERERFNLRFRSGTQALDDPLRLRLVRRDLARLKTVQRERNHPRVAAMVRGSTAAKGGK